MKTKKRNLRKKKIALLALTAVLALGAAGCGGSASPGGDSKQDSPAGEGNRNGGTAGDECQKIVRISSSEAEEGYSSELERLFAEGVGDILCREEMTWFGDPVSPLDYETAMASMEGKGFLIDGDVYDDGSAFPTGVAHYGENGTDVFVIQGIDEESVDYIDLVHTASQAGPAYTMEIREITLGDPMEVVLEKIGITNPDEIMAYIKEKQPLIYTSYDECKKTTDTRLELERADGSRTILGVSLYLTVEIDGVQSTIGVEDRNVAIYIGQYEGDDQECALYLVFDHDYVLRQVRLE